MVNEYSHKKGNLSAKYVETWLNRWSMWLGRLQKRPGPKQGEGTNNRSVSPCAP